MNKFPRRTSPRVKFTIIRTRHECTTVFSILLYFLLGNLTHRKRAESYLGHFYRHFFGKFLANSANFWKFGLAKRAKNLPKIFLDISAPLRWQDFGQ